MLTVHCVPAFEDNYIWLPEAAGSREVLIVDPGEAAPVLDALEREGLTPRAILVTHHHGDHTGGIHELLKRFALPVYGPARESIPGLTHPLADGDTVEAAGLRLAVFDTPGHTRGHICYYGEGALFCGDTLFTGGCGRLFEGTAVQMQASLARLRALPDETLIYCAHEYTVANLAFAKVAEPDNTDLSRRIAETDQRRARGEATVPAPLGLEKRTNPSPPRPSPVTPCRTTPRFSPRCVTGKTRWIEKIGLNRDKGG